MLKNDGEESSTPSTQDLTPLHEKGPQKTFEPQAVQGDKAGGKNAASSKKPCKPEKPEKPED